MKSAYIPDLHSFRPEKMKKVGVFDEPQLFVDVYCLEPGQEQTVHDHEGAAKVYYVLEGEGEFRIGDETAKFGPGHAVLARAGELHGVRAGEGRLVLMVWMAPNPNFP